MNIHLLMPDVKEIRLEKADTTILLYLVGEDEENDQVVMSFSTEDIRKIKIFGEEKFL